MDANTTQTDARRVRIGHEVNDIRRYGYACTLQQDDQHAYVSVQVDRDTNDGAQPVMIYMQLDAAFPASRPEMVVTILGPADMASSEAVEWELEIDSTTRLTWQPESTLRDIVMDIERGVHTEHLALAEAARSSSQIYQHSPLLEPYELLEDVQPSSVASPKRAGGQIAASLVGAILMLAAASVAYLLFFRDACAADWRDAQANLSSSDSAIVHQAVQVIESLGRRAQAGERGNCLRAAAPTALRDAYLRAGAAALQAKDAALARQDYQKALSYAADSADAKAGLQAATALLLQPAWERANRLSSTSSVTWTDVITNLIYIFDIDPQAINPSGGATITRQLYLAYMSWGDQLYQQDQLEQARNKYDIAQGFSSGDSRVGTSREWVELKRRVRDAGNTVKEWSAIVDTLKQHKASSPDALDPAGRKIDALLYTAYVRYGQALLELHGADQAMARDQAQAARELSDAADDKGQAARDLLAAAEKAQASASGTLAFQVQKLDATEWAAQLRKYDLQKARFGKPLNLIVVTTDTAITLTITLPNATATRFLNLNKDVASDAIDGGKAILRYTKGNQFAEESLDFSGGATYLVTLAPQGQP
jgi:hypothetical protein